MRLPPALRPLWPSLKSAYTLGTGAVSPLTRRLSRARGGLLPHAVVATAEDALRAGGEVVLARGPIRVSRAEPRGTPPRHPVFAAHSREEIPRVAVATLPGGRVLHPAAAVVTAQGALVAEFSPYFGARHARQHPLFLHPFPPPPTMLDERIAVLATRGDGNYYHFVMDVLPKLALLEAVSEPDRYYAPQTTPFQRELLALAGLRVEQLLDSGTHPHIQARELVVPGIPDAHLRTPPWVVEFLRARLRPKLPMLDGKRVYVTRGAQRHSRVVVNEDELLAALAPLGFTVLDPGALPVAEQIEAFAQAEMIVAPHGAGLANLAFAARGARVVELFPPRFVQGCYWKLAEAVGLDYRYVLGRGREPARRRRGRPELMRAVASDIVIDPREVVRQVTAPADHAAVKADQRAEPD